jgi:pyruvate/2-oxoglutarate dehydrogenase complex dihydrolipoamide dehydrogenase (E3) component
LNLDIGLAKAEAKTRVARRLLAIAVPMSAVLRTRIVDEPQGFMKVLVGAGDDRILGLRDDRRRGR